MTVDDRLRAAHARIADPDVATIARARALLLAELAGGEPHATDDGHAGAQRPSAPGTTGRPGETGTPSVPAAPGTTGRPCGTGASPPSSARRAGSFAARRAARLRPLRFALPLAALALAAVAAFAVLPRADVREPVRTPPPQGSPTAVTGSVLYQRNTLHVSSMYVGEDGRRTADARLAMFKIGRSVPEELWLAPDGSGRVVHGKVSEPHPLSPEDERAWRRAGSPDLGKLMGPAPPPKRTDYGPDGFPSSQLQIGNLHTVLPKRDPLSVVPVESLELRDFLVRAARKQRPHGSSQGRRDTFGQDVLTLLAYPESTRELRASLLGIVRNLAGARELGELTDPAGRTVRAFQFPLNMARGPVVAYDPATDRLMARGIMSAGGVVWATTYAIRRSGVGEIGDQP